MVPPAGATGPGEDDHFLAFINAWVAVTGMMNELARSMGQHDFYPFVMNLQVVAKLHFVHRFVTACRRLCLRGPPAAPSSVAGEEDPGAAEATATPVPAAH